MPSSLLRRLTRNSQVDWGRFDSDVYCDENYRALRDDDQEIAEGISEFFAGAASQAVTSTWRAVDVGTGSNLYPAFAMQPFCETISLREYSPSNVAWLHQQKEYGYDETWNSFWQVYGNTVAYKDYCAARDPRADFQSKASVEQSSVFELPEGEWDLGTMFFVACSLSTRRSEFRRAVRSFVASLKSGAPFAAAFMTNSGGYSVGETWFPAVSVDRAGIEKVLAPISQGLSVRAITSHVPVRPGVGMALATGFAR